MGKKIDSYAENFKSIDLEETISEDLEIIGNNIKSIRRKKKITQKELSLKTEISSGTLYRIENGIHKSVSYYQIKKISFALDVPISEILQMDFYSDKMLELNLFFAYLPFLNKSAILDIATTVSGVTDLYDLNLLKAQLHFLYHSLPSEIRNFITIYAHAQTSPSLEYSILIEKTIPEPYNKIMSYPEYKEIEKKYNKIVENSLALSKMITEIRNEHADPLNKNFSDFVF